MRDKGRQSRKGRRMERGKEVLMEEGLQESSPLSVRSLLIKAGITLDIRILPLIFKVLPCCASYGNTLALSTSYHPSHSTTGIRGKGENRSDLCVTNHILLAQKVPIVADIKR